MQRMDGYDLTTKQPLNKKHLASKQQHNHINNHNHMIIEMHQLPTTTEIHVHTAYM